MNVWYEDEVKYVNQNMNYADAFWVIDNNLLQ